MGKLEKNFCLNYQWETLITQIKFRQILTNQHQCPERYYANLNEKNVADNRKFWKTIKPLLSGKVKSQEKVISVENDKIITHDIKIAKDLNSFF